MSAFLRSLIALTGSAHAAVSCPDLLSGFSSEALVKVLETEVSESNRADLIELELTQDATHVLEAMPSFIPDRALTLLGKRALRKKMIQLLDLRSGDTRQPVILGMELRKSEIPMKSWLSTSQMIVRLRARREYLVPILKDYVKTLNHPALGDKVIRLDVLASPAR